MQRRMHADVGASPLHGVHKLLRVEGRDGAHDLCEDVAEIVCLLPLAGSGSEKIKK